MLWVQRLRFCFCSSHEKVPSSSRKTAELWRTFTPIYISAGTKLESEERGTFNRKETSGGIKKEG